MISNASFVHFGVGTCGGCHPVCGAGFSSCVTVCSIEVAGHRRRLSPISFPALLGAGKSTHTTSHSSMPATTMCKFSLFCVVPCLNTMGDCAKLEVSSSAVNDRLGHHNPIGPNTSDLDLHTHSELASLSSQFQSRLVILLYVCRHVPVFSPTIGRVQTASAAALKLSLRR